MRFGELRVIQFLYTAMYFVMLIIISYNTDYILCKFIPGH